MLEVAVRHRFAGFGLDVDFAAPAGVTVLFGRSGSGKTSVVNAVAGLLRADGARVVVGGVDVSGLPAHRRRIGYVFQDARLFPHLTVRQNIGYGRWFAGGAGDLGAVADLLGLTGLLDRRTAALSGGEAARVAIGRALLAAPRLLLMDEPLAALDAPRKAEILPYLERLRDEVRVPILYVSHALSEVARLATTLVVLDQGRVQRAGPLAEVLADPSLAPILGLREAGAVISARVSVQEADGLTRAETAGGPLFLPRVAAEVGTVLRLRIPAQDVILSRERPVGLSALNILHCEIVSLRFGDGPGALVQLRLGPELLLARITRRSAEALGLEPGMACCAILKSVAVAPGDIGV